MTATNLIFKILKDNIYTLEWIFIPKYLFELKTSKQEFEGINLPRNDKLLKTFRNSNGAMTVFLNSNISIVDSLFQCLMYGKINSLSLSLSLSLFLSKCNYLHVILFECTSAHYVF